MFRLISYFWTTDFRQTICWIIALLSWTSVNVSAAVVFSTDGDLGGGYRWDAASRTYIGNERSLDGGLRYSMQGGSLEAFRDLFSWDVVPTDEQFSAAIDQAFGAWMAIDPATGLGTDLFFINDTANTTVAGSSGFGGINTNGAEIDLFGTDAGDSGRRGVAQFSAVSGNVTLTSGTNNYGGAEGGGAIIGADLHINSNEGAIYSLDLFRRLLTHELGHSLGLGDVEDFFGNGFIDDNYDGSNSATALATLTNSWALLVDPLDPSASAGLTQFSPGIVANGNPGLDTTGVNILMESQGLGIGESNPVSSLFPLANDDYGARQFLYPVFRAEKIPEPSTMFLTALGLLACAAFRRRGSSADREQLDEM